jgi:hypothetical protein
MDETFESTIRSPQTATPPRPAGSVRRTSHVDMEHRADGVLVLHGSARDLVTNGAQADVTSHASVHAEVHRSRQLAVVETDPHLPELASLIGRIVGPGFRAALADAAPAEQASGSPLFLLLDELPVAAVISGYALMYSGKLRGASPDAALAKADICSGWRSDGTMMVSIRAHGHMPTPVGPTAPILTHDDPLGWHAMPDLAVGTMRRRRLVQVCAGQQPTVFAMFRDTHAGDDGVERVLHEYSLTARIDVTAAVLRQCVAVPHVLPWNECPDAADSAPLLNNQPIAAIRDLVRRDFQGIGTCTHLNDLFRSLGDLGTLLAQLPG